jgi:hypothetical protein
MKIKGSLCELFGILVKNTYHISVVTFDGEEEITTRGE